MKFFNVIRVLFVFFLVLIPLHYLFYYFNELAEKNETVIEELVKERLLSEMSKFQEDLNPENYIEIVFKDLEKQFGIPDFNNKQIIYTYNEENLPDFIDKNFIYKANNYLNAKYDLEPFIFISSDFDFSNIIFNDRENLISNENRNKFLYSCIASILFKKLNSELSSLNPLSNKTLKVFTSEVNNIATFTQIQNNTNSIHNYNLSFALEMIKSVSIFYKEIGNPNGCLSFFSNKFGNQKVYEYYNCLINKKNNRNNFLGLYYVLIKGSDINIKKLLYTACYASNSLGYTNIKRRISDKPIKIPTWSLSDNTIEYNIPFPSHFYNLILEHRNSNDETYKVYQDYIKNHSLTVSIEKKLIPNNYLVFRNIVNNIINFVLFIIFLYFFNLIFKLVKFNFSLSLKIRAVVFVAVMIPMIGLWIISYLGLENEKKIIISRTENIISERLALLDKIKNDVINNCLNDLNNDNKIITENNYKNFNPENNINSKIFCSKLNAILNEKYSELLSQDTSFTQVKYAIFERNAITFQEFLSQYPVYPFREMQLDSVKKALENQNSGSELNETEDYYYIKVWKYYNDNPVVFVAAAIIQKSQLTILDSNLLAVIFLIYSIFAVILLSDFFSGALLAPIRTLSKFVKEIGSGHLNVNIDMKTGDEMQDLSESFNKMSLGLCERENLKRFVSDKLYSRIEKSDENTVSKARVSILISDIRDFTTISENNKPEEVVNLLNDYFTLMEKSIVKYGGSIEKIIGDAISAAFYEDKNSEYIENACKAAIEMRENLKIFNSERKENNLFPIENGIGISTGEVIIGFAGEKARRREFVLFGDIIKYAENLESMTKYGVSSKIYIDEETFNAVKYKFDFCDNKINEDIFYRELKE